MNTTTQTYDLKQQFIEKFHWFELNNPSNEKVSELRKNAIQEFNKLGFPSTEMEDWKYTSVKAMQEVEYANIEPTDEENIDVSELLPENFDGDLLVFVNGYFSALNSNIQNKTTVFPISQIDTENEFLLANLETITNTDKNGFSALNSAFLNDGFVVALSESQQLEQPVFVVFFSDSETDNVFVNNRILIQAEKNAQAKIVTIHASLSEENVSVSNNVTEIFADKDANVEYYTLQLEGNNHSHINTIYTKQEKASIVTSNTFTLGGKLVRNGLNMYLNGEYGLANMNGLYLSNEDQLFDNHTRIDHAVPNCNSDEVYKGIMGGASTGVFNGQIHVYRDAQKTNAFQSNRNVVLTDEAQIFTKPQLEIYADDVQCSHGCTTGQLNQDAVFYMQARGIPKEEAQRILLQGFAGEVIDRIGIDSLKEFLTDLVADKLATMN